MRLLLSSLAILGLLAASLTASAAPASAVWYERYEGRDRFETSTVISMKTPREAGGTVFLASGLSFPDALAAGPVAAAEGAHLLLTRPDVVPEVVMEHVWAMQPREVVLVGSEATISERVRQQVAQRLPEARIERIGGTDRVRTSLLLLERMRERGGVEAAWVVSGFDFPDALVAASVAGRQREAIVLDWHGASAAQTATWHDVVAPALDGLPLRIAGGTPSVAAEDERLLRSTGSSVVRYAGADRYHTARLINAAFPAPAWGSMLIATGERFPDALSGAVLSASTGVPLYLSPSACRSAVQAELIEAARGRGVSTTIGLGSATSVSDEVLVLKPCPNLTPLQRTIGERYGMFEPEEFHGSGQGTANLLYGAVTGIVTATHDGSSAFSIVGRATSWQINQPVLATAGAWSGSVILDGDFAMSDDPYTRYLEVEADGAWTITVRDMTTAAELSGSQSGTGSTVLLYAGVGETLQIESSAAIEVSQRAFEGEAEYWDALLDAEGPFRGPVEAFEGPGWLEIVTDGDWTIRRP